jgi:hypothetical protein
MYVCICDDLIFLAFKYPAGIKKVNCCSWQREKCVFLVPRTRSRMVSLYAHGHGQHTGSLFFSAQYSVARYSAIPRRNHNAFFVLMQDVTVIINTWHFMSERKFNHKGISWVWSQFEIITISECKICANQCKIFLLLCYNLHHVNKHDKVDMARSIIHFF